MPSRTVKFKALNPKQIQNLIVRILKTFRFEHLNFVHSILFRISYFDIQIYLEKLCDLFDTFCCSALVFSDDFLAILRDPRSEVQLAKAFLHYPEQVI